MHVCCSTGIPRFDPEHPPFCPQLRRTGTPRLAPQLGTAGFFIRTLAIPRIVYHLGREIFYRFTSKKAGVIMQVYNSWRGIQQWHSPCQADLRKIRTTHCGNNGLHSSPTGSTYFEFTALKIESGTHHGLGPSFGSIRGTLVLAFELRKNLCPESQNNKNDQHKTKTTLSWERQVELMSHQKTTCVHPLMQRFVHKHYVWKPDCRLLPGPSK